MGRFYGVSHGRRLLKDVLGNHLIDRSFRLVHWLSVAQFLRRTSQESIIKETVLIELFFDYALYAGGNLEGDVLVADLRSWKRWTHRKSTQKDSMRKR